MDTDGNTVGNPGDILTMIEIQSLEALHRSLGATLANDGIPLHYGDLAAEYRAAHETAVIMDRSHEGRLTITGRDRLAVLHRISTNHLERLTDGEGAPTVFTNANARILDRATVYHRGDEALLTAEPGRGSPLRAYLQRSIFFNDEAQISDLAELTRQFAIHGVKADESIAALVPDAASIPAYGHCTIEIDGAAIFIGRRAPLIGSAWTVIAPSSAAGIVWSRLTAQAHPAGSLTYNNLRVEAGRPGGGRELTEQYIPLEVGLWDEVSFNKGCYTGQEIIARMESRGRLARTIVCLRMNSAVDAPAPLTSDGREFGTLTSSAQLPDGAHIGIGVVKIGEARIGRRFTTPSGAAVEVIRLPGAQPPFGLDEETVNG
jgi:aminomethyltransferase